MEFRRLGKSGLRISEIGLGGRNLAGVLVKGINRVNPSSL